MSEANRDIFVCDEVREVQRLHGDLFTYGFRRLCVRDQLDQQARRILAAHPSGNRAVVTHIGCWHPDLVGCGAEEIMSRELTLEDARQTIAREYGFTDWATAEAQGTHPPDADFEAAIDALLCGNVAALQGLLADKPALVTDRSAYGHRSTLLHYVGSNGVETHRQVVPRNLAAVTQILIDAGADVNATAEMYGGGSTTIALLITSSHPAAAGVVDEVVQLLIDAGAVTDS